MYRYLYFSLYLSHYTSLPTQLIKSFDFEVGFCIPGSVNTWDAVYSLPALGEKLSKFRQYNLLSHRILLQQHCNAIFLNFCASSFLSHKYYTHTVNDMIEHPFETKSDSFYFVDDRLIMHNKASYKVSESLVIVIAIAIAIEVMH